MMKNKVSEFKLLNVDFFNLIPKVEKSVTRGTLIGKYPLWFNQVTDTWMHSKSFGDYADHEFGTDTGVTVRFVLDREVLEVACYAHGGMTWLQFDEGDIQNMKGNYKECAEYTLQMIKDFTEHNIIEETLA